MNLLSSLFLSSHFSLFLGHLSHHSFLRSSWIVSSNLLGFLWWLNLWKAQMSLSNLFGEESKEFVRLISHLVITSQEIEITCFKLQLFNCFNFINKNLNIFNLFFEEHFKVFTKLDIFTVWVQLDKVF